MACLERGPPLRHLSCPCPSNGSSSSRGAPGPSFLLSGLLGPEASRLWLALPFSAMYAVALLGNGTILGVVLRGEPAPLRAPMYLFLAMLAAADLGLASTTFPTLLRLLWSGARETSFGLCLAQMFFIHTFTDLESAVLLAMAFDRYVAICLPLRYTSLLTGAAVAKIGTAIVVRTVAIQTPLPLLLAWLQFGRTVELDHAYCLHPDIIHHSCSDARVNSTYGLFVLLSTLGLDLLLILLSYALILRVVLSTASQGQHLKALSTCLSHICAVFLFFTPMIGLSMTHRFGKRVPRQVYVLLSYLHFLVPPVLNPVVYSVKTKEIRVRILSMVPRRRASRSNVASDP